MKTISRLFALALVALVTVGCSVGAGSQGPEAETVDLPAGAQLIGVTYRYSGPLQVLYFEPATGRCVLVKPLNGVLKPMAVFPGCDPLALSKNSPK